LLKYSHLAKAADGFDLQEKDMLNKSALFNNSHNERRKYYE